MIFMKIELKQVSSLEKIRSAEDFDCKEIKKKIAFAGERVSYQICMNSDSRLCADISVESELKKYIKMYSVKNVYMDKPTIRESDADYITKEPGMMPDVLIPLEEQSDMTFVNSNINSLWVRIDIPKDMQPGTYAVTIHCHLISVDKDSSIYLTKQMNIEIIPFVIPEQKLIYTRWFYADCIADYHHVEVYSEEHWELIEKYIAAATDSGINMILVPIHTPPLNTAIGGKRTCVQLVDIEKKGDVFEFNFDKFTRFINICKKNGVKYYEMAHMFSQWGAKYSPNIVVTENGIKDYMFGWDVAANSDEYIHFLKQYISAIVVQLKKEGISENTFFHISDEPSLQNIDTYKIASEILRPMIGKSKTMEALSKYKFYEEGLVQCPVTNLEHIHEFLDHSIEDQWVYCCMEPEKIYSNNFLAMPSWRIRVLGFQMYRYGIKGFLHWGYNFYNSYSSRYPVNPYLCTSADGVYPSGDPFIVYPGFDTVYTSIRAEIIYDAIQDMNICYALENKIGREAVEKLIDSVTGYTLRFDKYPSGNTYFEDLRLQMIERLRA